MKKIAAVIAVADDRILISFDTKESLLLDMKEKLLTARFSDLKDVTRFSAVKTDGRSIFWPGDVSISISELMEMIATVEAQRHN
jgi:hypothetical protein